MNCCRCKTVFQSFMCLVDSEGFWAVEHILWLSISTWASGLFDCHLHYQTSCRVCWSDRLVRTSWFRPAWRRWMHTVSWWSPEGLTPTPTCRLHRKAWTRLMTSTWEPEPPCPEELPQSVRLLLIIKDYQYSLIRFQWKDRSHNSDGCVYSGPCAGWAGD